MAKFKLQKKTLVYDGRIVRLVVSDGLIRGRKARWEVVHHIGSVGIIPFLTKDKVVLVEQFRYAVGERLLEIPAGTLHKGEAPLSAAKREIQEEIGYAAGRLEKINIFYPSPGVTDEFVIIYKATGLRPSKLAADFDEDIKVRTVKLSDALRYIKEGRIRDAKTIIALLLAAEKG
ncbi:MAG: NUDIX hydrolase [Candidatus Omnitrophica bacterium]|nr:NUDIX hydrolase [Candidatus Omnitrophota bacterium]MDD5546177.1 NUDIX hydrolase [Candidatus Omnitrophota bacterium]